MQADIQMPVIINQRQRREDCAVPTSDFSDGDSDNIIFIQVIAGEERFWRLERSSQPYSLVEISSYGNKPRTIPFARLDESESLSDSSILDSEFITSLSEDEEDDIDESFFSGIQIFEYPRKVLFNKKIKVKTSELKKRSPQIIIEPYLLEDDE